MSFFDEGYDESLYKEEKKIKYEIGQLVLQKGESEQIKRELWQYYLESEEFDETEMIELNKKQQKQLKEEKGYNTEENKINILNLLGQYNEQQMLEEYCKKTIEKRKGKIQKKLVGKEEDKNMYLISVSLETVKNPEYIMSIIEKNKGKTTHMAYILELIYIQMYNLYILLQEKKDKEEIEKKLRREEKSVKMNDQESQQEMKELIIKKKQFDKILEQKTFFKTNQKVYSSAYNMKSLYVTAVDDEFDYVKEKLLQRMKEIKDEKEECVICHDVMNKSGIKIKVCEECGNYYHEKCTKTIEKCPMCREKL